ncbi:hypothetical protein P256_00723 [Acinetobacter nectaris CIP 110549]|uniref:Phage antitermination protein Q n=1 Tax=Acinetobacter nectaris CIP 110549 TaxID=1392540 RepID=V2TQI8_9GAMM|nr:hypothetical protein [Acinetobacter nectaris]ESK40276.1 hypothetical protein P256_00723 [Acinetobacter nectaris CIP 110549]
MNAVAERHIMQVMDWSKYSLEEWLYQFGAWQYSSSGTCGKSINPIAVAMDQAVVKRKKFKLGVKKQRQVIADYMVSDLDTPKPRRSKFECNITDDEARAVQHLILDMQGKSEILDEWLDAVIDRYFYGNSWADMVTESRTGMDAKYDVKCGLAALHVRYPFIIF